MNGVIGVIMIITNFLLKGYLFFLIVRALRKYINSKEISQEKQELAKSLGQVLKEYRIRCNMTQEFVAKYLGISRQAV